MLAKYPPDTHPQIEGAFGLWISELEGGKLTYTLQCQIFERSTVLQKLE